MNDDGGISVHDNFLVSYEVLCARREIVLHTEYRDGGEPFECTDVRFSGVECHAFEHTSEVNILFDVEEVPAKRIYEQHTERMRAGSPWGWPGPWAATAELAESYFAEQGLRGFEVIATCGLSGWVIAREMRRTRRPPP